jgi:hypothetical protein
MLWVDLLVQGLLNDFSTRTPGFTNHQLPSFGLGWKEDSGQSDPFDQLGLSSKQADYLLAHRAIDPPSRPSNSPTAATNSRICLARIQPSTQSLNCFTLSFSSRIFSDRSTLGALLPSSQSPAALLVVFDALGHVPRASTLPCISESLTPIFPSCSREAFDRRHNHRRETQAFHFPCTRSHCVSFGMTASYPLKLERVRRRCRLFARWLRPTPVTIYHRKLRQALLPPPPFRLPPGAQGRTPMNIQFDRISWMCPITEVVSLLSDEPGTTWIFHGNAKLEDWP